MRDRTLAPSRMLIYLVVSLIAAAYLVPLVVVVLNSLRTAEEIAHTSMIGWPKQWAWSNYVTAWADFCVAQTCNGIRPYMLNSAIVTIPATIISTMLGAVAVAIPAPSLLSPCARRPSTGRYERPTPGGPDDAGRRDLGTLGPNYGACGTTGWARGDSRHGEQR